MCGMPQAVPIDGGVVVAYLAAYLLKGGRRIADTALESLLDRLVERVAARLGPRPLNTLEQDPADRRNQQLVAGKIDEAIRADQSLARELTQLVGELNRHGGQQFVNEVYAQKNIQAWGGGHAVGRDLIYAPAPHDPRITAESSAWVKVLAMLGALLCLGAFGLFGYTLFTDDRPPGSTGPPDGIVGAGAVFFAGLVVMALAGFANLFTKRPPPRF
jgi:hypothetical protein